MNPAENKTVVAKPSALRFARPQLRRFLRVVERVLAVVGLCFVIYQLFFEVSVIVTGSMSPGLQGESYATGDRVLMEKITPWLRSPRRWEIYFFYNSEGTAVAKRIVGLPGEKISIKDNKIFINGTEAQPPDGFTLPKYYGYGRLANGKEADCGTGYFTLGDDSSDSYDSRYLGLVARKDFRGRAWLILWPFNHLGFVH